MTKFVLNDRETDQVLTITHYLSTDLAWPNFSQAFLLYQNPLNFGLPKFKLVDIELFPLTVHSKYQLTAENKKFQLNYPDLAICSPPPTWPTSLQNSC